MKLALKYALFYKSRSLVFIGILSIILALPFISEKLSRSLVENVDKRTTESPIVISSRAGKIRQSLSSLFFITGQEAYTLSYGTYEEILDKDGIAIPLLVKHQTKYAPLVATEIDYFSFRELGLLNGNFFALPGDIVIGHTVANKNNIQIGDRLKVQSNDLYDITQSAPIDLKVVGILKRKNTPDDIAIYTSLQTIWVLEGHLHSHSEKDDYKTDNENETKYSKSLTIKQKVTDENFLDFHFHDEISALPITHIIFRGNTHKSEVLLMNELNQKESLMAFRPEDSMNHVVDILLSLENFFATYHLFWSLCSITMFLLIFGLMIQSREEEFQILIALGASRNLMWRNLAQLIAIYLISGTFLGFLWYFVAQTIMEVYIL
ncbi:MAG: ABC transporter permease [Bacteriovoracaceae bacterium]